MSSRSTTFYYHVKYLLDKAIQLGWPEEKIKKLKEIAERWEERRLQAREGQS